jgi:high-affinity nickel permease
MHESIWLVLGLGFILGIKHATEADHLVCVATIVK